MSPPPALNAPPHPPPQRPLFMEAVMNAIARYRRQQQLQQQ